MLVCHPRAPNEPPHSGGAYALRARYVPYLLLLLASLVVPGEKEVEERHDGTFEFRATAGVDGRGREGLPYDRLADVGSNEEGGAKAKTIAIRE